MADNIEDQSPFNRELRIQIERKAETENLEYKGTFHWTNDKSTQLKVLKAILGFANTKDGGRIIVGISEPNHDLVGVNEEDFQSFDPTKINNSLHAVADPPFSCEVYRPHFLDVNLVVINVPEFASIPIICKSTKATPDNQQTILERGSVYIRTAKPSTEKVTNEAQMRDIFDRAIVRSGDRLLRQIQQLVMSNPTALNEYVGAKNPYADRIADSLLKIEGIKYGAN